MFSINKKSIGNYWKLGEIKSVKPFGSGHINDTYLVSTGGQQFILQRVNKHVFNTPRLVSNYELLVKEVRYYQDNRGVRITPDIYKTKNGVHHYIDSDNYAWRLVEFIPDAIAYDISTNPEISYKAAKAVGSYQVFLNTIDPNLPCDTIKGFHNLPARLINFNDTLDTCDRGLVSLADAEISEIKSMTFIEKEAVEILCDLQPRVTHNDTKLNNTLFVGDRCLTIDLDTVMKGYVMLDYGDMVRSFTSPASEDEPDISKTILRTDHFEALTRGYLEVLKGNLTEAEKISLIIGALYIIYEQAIRFLTDYLKGNVYYKIAYPDHNLIRTRTQIKLLKDIIDNRAGLENIVHKHF